MVTNFLCLICTRRNLYNLFHCQVFVAKFPYNCLISSGLIQNGTNVEIEKTGKIRLQLLFIEYMTGFDAV